MHYKSKDLARKIDKSGDTGTPSPVFFPRPDGPIPVPVPVILENTGESPPVPGGDPVPVQPYYEL